MIFFFETKMQEIIAVGTQTALSSDTIDKLVWLFGNSTFLGEQNVHSTYVGPRSTMITPWSTNAVEITQNMGIQGIDRIEKYLPEVQVKDFDKMTQQKFDKLGADLFDIRIEAESIIDVKDIATFNQKEGLALSDEEVNYLEELSVKLGRPLTDSEVFGFSQVNSEHCRHKIFNGTFIIDGEEKEQSLFQLIKKTSQENRNSIISAYKDNVAFVRGPKNTEQFAPECPDKPSLYKTSTFDSVISLKAETHNFPTTVEPFNGAATGSGGEIRDRLAGGQGSIPLAGTAVYMTSYPRFGESRSWVDKNDARPWLYQSPLDILIKASNGASDFGNKFGQPLICGSLLTFEHAEHNKLTAYDKVIMQAGGIGYGIRNQAQKELPQEGNDIVILGGDNYRIGMGGAAVSSADTGEFSTGIELNAVQRSNPEMQKRVANTIRAMVESGQNPIVSIHDHGAGGHLNCLSELVEETGGAIELDALPIGDSTLSAKEIIGNESQERMGLVIDSKDYDLLEKVAMRERSPIYKVGKVTDDHRFVFNNKKGKNPIDLALGDMFGSSPKTIMEDRSTSRTFDSITSQDEDIYTNLKKVLQLESVACKDWLTNKVDRCVGGRVAIQQCAGPLQLPLNNCAVMTMDFNGKDGIATSIGEAPIAGLLDSAAGSRVAIAESLTNIIWAPLQDGIKSISLSANWMWPCKNEGEDARLYKAVEAVSDFAIDLGVNVPTGKDSLSMAQKYTDQTVLAPGTVIISATGHCRDIRNVVEPVLQNTEDAIYYIDMSNMALTLGGSAFGQINNQIGGEAPDIKDAESFVEIFELIQKGIKKGLIKAGHDISSGGLITCLLEMCFADTNLGADIDFSSLIADNDSTVLFAENPGIIIQATQKMENLLNQEQIPFAKIGQVTDRPTLQVKTNANQYTFDIAEYRDAWYHTSFLFDKKQTANNLAQTRFEEYKNQPLRYRFPDHFTGDAIDFNAVESKPLAAIIREKGSNSEREMANALYRAGFEVRDVHMTDLISGRETLEDVQFLGAVGGFSNSDVLGSAKGWAGAFKYNEKANEVLTKFFQREDTMSIGICNGCQLFLELDLINPEHESLSKMTYNDSHKHESSFTSVTIQENNSIMMSDFAGATLGVWISHGEGKFHLPMQESDYNVVGKYGYAAYPANPNGSDYNVAMLVSDNGRHLVTMPHIERSFFAWNWAHYPKDRQDEWSPWAQAFVNARKWCQENKG